MRKRPPCSLERAGGAADDVLGVRAGRDAGQQAELVAAHAVGGARRPSVAAARFAPRRSSSASPARWPKASL